MALHSGDLAGALGHLTALRDAMTDQPPSRALADCLAIRSVTLSNLGRIAEAADDGHRALALAQELGYPAGEALALYDLAVAAQHADDCGGAVRLARQAQQIPADIPGRRARECSSTLTNVLTAAGDLTAARDRHQASLDIATRLAAADPANTQWQRDLLYVRQRIADLGVAPQNS